ncbi:MAG: hypothetical protein ABJB86_03220 [Bacteroidota bacterium]
MNKKYGIFLFAIFLMTAKISAQTVVVTDDNTYVTGQASSVLDVKSTSKGFLAPRMTGAQRVAITSPAEGLLVYQTDGTKGFYYYTNSSWTALSAGSGSQWTTSGNNIYYNTGNVGVGVTTPLYPLSVKDTLEIRRTGTVSELLFTNTSGSGDLRIAGDGGDIFWQGGGGRNLQMGAYWGMVLSGDRQSATIPAFSNGVANTNVLALAQRDASVPLAVQGNSATQSANLMEWRSSAATLNVVDKNGNFGIGVLSPSSKLHVAGTNPLTLNGVQTGAVSDSLLTIASGIVRKLPFSSIGGAWGLTGNAGTTAGSNFIGTTDNSSLKFRTNGVQGMMIDSLGNVGIGTSPSFTAGTFREKLLVDAGVTNSYNAIVAKGSINNYLQLNVQNLSNGVNASSDVVATADNGNESINYIDMGINSSTNTQAVMGAANDAYLYTTGNNFLMGTGTAAKSLVFMTGGTTQSTNERMRIDGSGYVGIGTSSPSSDLTLFQNAGGSYPSKGFRFTGNSIGGTNTGSGFSMALGYNQTGNKQLWLGDADYLGNPAGTFLRYTIGSGVATFDAVAGDNSVRRTVGLGDGGDPLAGVILGSDGSATAPSSFIWGNGNVAIGNGYRANAAPANGMIVQGNMGIGTTAPASALHVVGTNPLTLNGVQTGAISDSLLTIASGIVRKLPFSSISNGAWSLSGNAGTTSGSNYIGTTDNSSLKFRTNSVQGMVLDSLGNVGIGAAPAFTAGAYQEALLVDAGSTSSFNAIVARGSVNNYLQLNIQNKSNGTSASSDIVATADNGTESINYVDMGINSSTNTQNIMGASNDGYLYTTGNNFLIGNATASKSLVFLTGGTTQSTNERMRIDGSGNIGMGVTAPAQKLDVNGNLKLSGAFMPAGAAGNSGEFLVSSGAGLAPTWLNANSYIGAAAWLKAGNAGTNSGTSFIGTTDNTSIRFRTNNVQGMVLDSLGNVGIGVAPAFTIGASQEALLVDAGTTSSFNAIVARGIINNYFQLNIQNQSNGVSASADIVATSDNGTESVNFIDMGINSSANTQNIMGSANDAYLYTTGNNMLIGTGTASKALVFLTGGTTQSTNERMRIDGTGDIGIGVTVPTATLHLKAGSTGATNAPLKFTAGTNMTTPEAGAVEFDGTNYFATSGTTRYTLAKTLTATSTLNFISTAAFGTNTLTIAVAGAADGDVVQVGPPNAASSTGGCYTAYVSAAGIVTIRFNNYTNAAIDPASGVFRVSIIKY